MKNTFIILLTILSSFIPTKIKNLLDNRKKQQYNNRMNAHLASLIESTKGKFFSITFIKKDGSVRIVNAKDKYIRLLRGGDNKVAAAGYTSFVDRNKESWVCAKDSNTVSFKCGKREETFSV